MNLDTPCILWQACLDRDGYGRKGRLMAHRVEYEEKVGPIPEGLTIDHLCGNKGCINVEHMEPVTRAENLRRGHAWRARVIHCYKGHPYDAANTYIDKQGRRFCRACNREVARVYRASRRAL